MSTLFRIRPDKVGSTKVLHFCGTEIKSRLNGGDKEEFFCPKCKEVIPYDSEEKDEISLSRSSDRSIRSSDDSNKQLLLGLV